MRVLVAGGAGYIGSVVTAALLASTGPDGDGLIEASVVRDDAPAPGNAWHGVPGFC